MHSNCVVAVYDSNEDAKDAVHLLHDSSFPSEQVSLVLGNLAQHPEVVEDLEAGEDSPEDVMVGTGLGSLVGVMTGASILAFSGTIFLVIGALGGLVTGALVGSLLGAMSGWGVHGHRVEHYEKLVNSGHPLLIAHGDPLEVADAFKILEETSTRELRQYATSADETSPST